jgi:hypothetical protein
VKKPRNPAPYMPLETDEDEVGPIAALIAQVCALMDESIIEMDAYELAFDVIMSTGAELDYPTLKQIVEEINEQSLPPLGKRWS